MRSVLLMFTVLLGMVRASGQKAVADSTHHADTVRLHLAYTGTGTINDANHLHSFVLSNALRMSLAKKSSELNWSNNWLYGKQDYVLTNNDITSTLDWALYKTIRHFYYWGMATYSHSVPLMIQHQGQAGLGPGYNVVDKKTLLITMSDGLLFELGDLYDSLYGQPGGNVLRHDRYHAVRNSAHVMFHWVIHGQYLLEGSGFLQNRLSDWSDYILRLTGRASVNVYKWIAFTTSASYAKFTRTRGQNTLFSFGLTVTK